MFFDFITGEMITKKLGKLPLFKYVKSKTKIHKNISTVNKKNKTDELTDKSVKTAGVLARVF